ncbi:MAG TPA: hypothetical protein VGN37_25050 [Actinocatenispora sp.]
MSDPEETRPEVLHGQGTPEEPAAGCGPGTDHQPYQRNYHHPAAGWGAARSVGDVLWKRRELLEGPRVVLRMNHENGGFDCPGCAWPGDRKGLRMDICENGIKHSTWEMTPKRVGREFFAQHTVTELAGWSDFALEDAGRLTEPMAYDPETDRYVPISWPAAFELVGETLRGLDSPDRAAFYTSGRLGNEASFLYQWVRPGVRHEQLPGLFEHVPRGERGRPFRVAGYGEGHGRPGRLGRRGRAGPGGRQRRVEQPADVDRAGEGVPAGCGDRAREPARGGGGDADDRPARGGRHGAVVGDAYQHDEHAAPIGGDAALLRGVAKALLETARTDETAIDRLFLDRFTHGFAEYEAACGAVGWDELERQSGVSEERMRELSATYRHARTTVIAWCLGVTQQEHGVDTVREIVNLLLLRGNIGRSGAGPCPIRGHSNVQGNCTCGIDHRPSDAMLDRIAAACRITPPRGHGWTRSAR